MRRHGLKARSTLCPDVAGGETTPGRGRCCCSIELTRHIHDLHPRAAVSQLPTAATVSKTTTMMNGFQQSEGSDRDRLSCPVARGIMPNSRYPAEDRTPVRTLINF